jgi:hypothetical protein
VEALIHKRGFSEGRGRITIQGKGININYTVEDSVLTVAPHEGNPPNASSALRLIPPGGGANQKIHFNSGIRYNGWHARVSTLRAAYLAAFAKFGYGYIMHPRLAPVRHQIQHPDEKTLSGFSIDPDYDGHKGPEMAIFWNPVPCLLVRVNQRAALLPIPVGTQWRYPFPAPIQSKHHRLRLEGGRVLTWPRTLEMRRDFGVEAA